ncbi:MAG: 5'-methylthioadenosine/adenosylhomocysteine nucleosidase [Bacteroidaceae bacterium]|nr:5'-methylthioadenosine/adenosylhomocysteine nucleosidase [Bacteroidaceae bacterium]
MKIGIIAAMSSEYKQVAQLLENKKDYTEGIYEYTEGKVKNNTVILTKCGIGKVNAAAGAVELIRTFQPDCIISTGVAGGIDKCLKIMDVVASQQIVYHDVWCGEGNAYGQIQGLPTFFEGNDTLLSCAISLDTDTPIHSGLICSGDKFITDREELNIIKDKFPEGLAVDMESGAIAQVCYIYKVPFISFRIISDTPGAENHWEQYTNFWGEMADRSFGVTKAFLEALPNQIQQS